MIDPNDLTDQMEYLADIPPHMISPALIPYLADLLEPCPATGLALSLMGNPDAPISQEMRFEIAYTMLKQSRALSHFRQDAFYRAAMPAA